MEQKLNTMVDRSQIWVSSFSASDRAIISSAARLMGLRKTEFYRRAIVEKAQSVLSRNSSRESNEIGASSIREQSRVEDASFLSAGENL